MLIVIHLVVGIVPAFVSPDAPNPGMFVLYITIAILSKIGLPVFSNPLSGWGWSTPNLFGWTMGVIVWLVGYLGVAYIITKRIKLR